MAAKENIEENIAVFISFFLHPCLIIIIICSRISTVQNLYCIKSKGR
jgi:hypothetical protein